MGSNKQKIGLITATALVVGNMIGSGIFVLPATLAKYGSISLLGWLFTAAGALVLAKIFSNLSKIIINKSGGPYVFAKEGHIDHGKNVAAYYYWVFPNMMFNFYPWGLSVNVVKPIDAGRTKVSFISYVLDPTKLGKGAGSQLEKVEREDEFVVENVHNGIRSNFYKAGRFSPTREQGVHHFHRLLADFLSR